MKRRFRRGVELTDAQFTDQPWTKGMLQLEKSGLYLCESTPGHNPPPYGTLHRPALKAVYSDSISFTGIEEEGGALYAQVWYCETRGATAE
ncbi:hypothetical protein [Variovorax sp. PBL-E5]|uniref:hypothetical protein n=1 Tax=Variovorax sp. PBL-E5 TaxID=434014 RepID=UPI0013198469|nr:hypothetical protein [Variovorax sp. PBL-E5]VTU36193.1 hypothetical protein E5CHR_04252 [Variovorax sp. PBL-E5]